MTSHEYERSRVPEIPSTTEAYRDEARRLRAAARSVVYADVRESLFYLAREYEVLADHAAGLHRHGHRAAMMSGRYTETDERQDNRADQPRRA
jgi:hypothetical protein